MQSKRDDFIVPNRSNYAIICILITTGIFDVVILTIFMSLILNGNGGAFMVFYHAATSIVHGHSPYAMASGQLLNTVFPYAPWVAWLIVPLTTMSLPMAYVVWLAVSVIGAISAAGWWGRQLEWKPWWLPILGLMGWDVLWRCLLTGQMDGILLVIETMCLGLALRGKMGWAGALAVMTALYKPQVFWLFPVLLLWFAFQERKSRLFIAGAAFGLLALLLPPEIIHPGITTDWLRTLPNFSSSLAGIQPDLAGLPGLLRLAPSTWGLRPSLNNPATISIVLIGLGLIGTASWSWRNHPEFAPDRSRRLLWQTMLPMGIWFLVSPYTHTNDALTLLPLALLVIAELWRSGHKQQSVALLAVLSVVPEVMVLFNPSYVLGYLSTTSIAIAALVIVAWMHRPTFALCTHDETAKPPALR
jgi:hypothetical protein